MATRLREGKEAYLKNNNSSCSGGYDTDTYGELQARLDDGCMFTYPTHVSSGDLRWGGREGRAARQADRRLNARLGEGKMRAMLRHARRATRPNG